MADEKNLIKKIVLDIEGNEISLTPEQAHKLCTALMDLLGVNKRVETEYVSCPYPIYPSYLPYWPYGTPHVTWGAYGGQTSGLYSTSYTSENSTAKITL